MKDRLLFIPQIFLCRFCKVQVVDKNDFRPILGRNHKKSCPRHKKYG